MPADTPFVVVAKPLALTDAELAAHMHELANSPGLHQAIRNRLIEVLGVDVFDPQSVAETGLDLRGDFALFGVGLRPAALVKIENPQRFAVFLEKLRTEQEGVVFANQVVNGVEIDSLLLGRIRISFSEVGEYLLLVYHHTDDDAERVLSGAMVTKETGDLGHSTELQESLATLAGSPSVMGLANMAALDVALLQAARPESSPRFALVPEDSRKNWVESERARLSRCQARGAVVARAIPRVIGALRWSDGTVEQELVIQVSPELRQKVQKVLVPVSGDFGPLSSGAIAAFGLGLDMAELVAIPANSGETVLCPNLAALEGAASLLISGLEGSDAPYVFAQNIYGMLYDFDFDLWLSKRSMVLLFESLDTTAMVDGFDMYFRGIGFLENGTEDDGVQLYRAFRGLVGVSIAPFDNHVALVLGNLDRENVESALASDSEPREEFAVLEIDGTRLYEMLTRALETAPLAGFDSGLATSFVETFSDLESSLWTGTIVGDAVVLKARWTSSAPAGVPGPR